MISNSAGGRLIFCSCPSLPLPLLFLTTYIFFKPSSRCCINFLTSFIIPKDAAQYNKCVRYRHKEGMLILIPAACANFNSSPKQATPYCTKCMQQSDGLEFKRIVSPPKCFFLGLDKRKDENSSFVVPFFSLLLLVPVFWSLF